MRGRLRSHLLPALALLGALVAIPAGDARAQDQRYRVVLVPGLELADLAGVAGGAAVGLLVPGAGPRVSEAAALAALERGAVRNSLRGGLPAGEPRIAVERGDLATLAPGTIVLSLPTGGDQPNDRRYPIAVMGPGFSGLLGSPSTRIPGLVSVADVAPTALGEPGGLSARASSDPLAALAALDGRISANGETRPLAALLAGLLVLAVAGVSPRAALLGLAAALAANLALGAAGVSTFWLVLLVTGVAVALGGPLLALLAPTPLRLAIVLAAVVAGYLAALGLDGASVALSPLGPTQNSRFYGLSNLLSALLLLPSLAAVALLRTAAGLVPAALAAAVALVTVAGSRFGADGGGAIVLLAGLAVLGVELTGARRRAALWTIGLGVAAVAAVLALDAATGSSSHLTRAVGGGPGGLVADLRDRVVLSWERATERWYLALLVLLGAALLAILAARLVLLDVTPARRALPLAVALAVGASLLVNDSPLDVTAVGLVSYLVAQGYALFERPAPGRLRPQLYRSVET